MNTDTNREAEQLMEQLGGSERSGPKRGLPRPPLFTTDYIAMAEILEFALDRFGQLVLALMYYTMDGTMPDGLPPDLKMMFSIYQRKVDAAREKYGNKCATNAKNGSKGGRPRKGTVATEPEEVTTPHEAEPPKKAKATPKIKMPPSEEQFTKLLKEKQAKGIIAEECNPVEFFEWAEQLKWKVNGEPAENVGDFLDYAAARHPTKVMIDTIGIIPKTPQLAHAYGIIFKALHGLRDEDGNTRALAAAINFLKAYDGGWTFHGQLFSDDQWWEALNEFMENLKTE